MGVARVWLGVTAYHIVPEHEESIKCLQVETAVTIRCHGAEEVVGSIV